MGQCKALTSKGAQCKRKALPGRRYCWQHESTVVRLTLGGIVASILAIIGLWADLSGLGFSIPTLNVTATPLSTQSTPTSELQIFSDSIGVLVCDFDGPYGNAAANMLAGRLEREIKTDAFNPVSVIVEGNNAPSIGPSSSRPLWEIRRCFNNITSSEDAINLAENTNARIVVYGEVNSIDEWYELQVSVVRNASWKHEAISHLTDEYSTWHSNPTQASEFVNSVLSDMTTEPLIYFYMVAASDYIELNRHLSAIQLLEIAEERALEAENAHALSRIYYGFGILYNFDLIPTWQQYSSSGGHLVPTWNNSEKSISFLRQALETDPTFWIARVRLGLMLATEGYMDEAHTELLRAYRDSEGDPYAKDALDQVQK